MAEQTMTPQEWADRIPEIAQLTDELMRQAERIDPRMLDGFESWLEELHDRLAGRLGDGKAVFVAAAFEVALRRRLQGLPASPGVETIARALTEWDVDLLLAA